MHLLASHPDAEEYQIDRTIVWIMIPNHGERQNWIAEGRALFCPVWKDMHAVIAMANSHSQMQHPEFWRQPELELLTEPILALRGIWVYPVDGSATYEVYDTGQFPSDSNWNGHLLPDDYFIVIARDRDGRLSIRA